MSQIPTPTTPGNGGSAADDLASMAHESIDRMTPKVKRAENAIRDTAARTAEGARQLEEQALDTARDGLHKAQASIEQNPLLSAGIAFAAGALLSLLIRR
jgi:ElaB/YqjD/DUF883 family membrane-anchored ribosome-binding protein